VHRAISILAGIGAFALVSAGLAGGAYWYWNAPPRQAGETVSFEVYKGETALSVGTRLEQAGLIKSRHLWYVLLRLDERSIKAGRYRIAMPISQTDLREMLVAGAKEPLLRVTIPEGVTLKKIAHIFDAAGVCEAEKFLAAAGDPEILREYRIPGDTMEGFLYPETYLFPAEYPPSLAVKAMADTFFRRLAETGADPGSLSPEELYRKVTLASIIEREYRVDEEAKVMSGVFYNRLNIGMPLQSCATVEYVITEILGKPHPKVIYNKDTEIKNPYNTYVMPGLPPGPISAPGAIALEAAFNPESSDYLYFRLVDVATGKHYFSRTFDDHIKAGVLYVKGNQNS
jgi:UPF0755 protein